MDGTTAYTLWTKEPTPVSATIPTMEKKQNGTNTVEQALLSMQISDLEWQ